jgi:hypothetical protein
MWWPCLTLGRPKKKALCARHSRYMNGARNFFKQFAQQIQGFTTEGEAARWIRNESAVCLHARRRDEAAS